MARSDLLINLVKASSNGDKQMVHRTVEAIVAEERAKRHNVLAERLESALKMNGNGSSLRAVPQGPDTQTRARSFVSEAIPRRNLNDLVLPWVTERAIRQLIEEQQRASLLRSHSLEPRHRVLLVGPPLSGRPCRAARKREDFACRGDSGIPCTSFFYSSI
jgi:hypothetical protein